MKPYYDEDDITIYCGDARKVLKQRRGNQAGCLIIDPPFDEFELFQWAYTQTDRVPTSLVFTDPRYLGMTVQRFGSPKWVFTWDTMSPWNLSDELPLTQTKFALWYGKTYARDGLLWGHPPAERNHPTTKQRPRNGRRLTDMWRESLRWLHHPTAATGAAGTERFSTRQGLPAMRHAKPIGWVTCLIANTSSGLIIDPFMGSGTALIAARQLGRKAVGVDIDEQCCALAVERLRQGTLPLEEATS